MEQGNRGKQRGLSRREFLRYSGLLSAGMLVKSHPAIRQQAAGASSSWAAPTSGDIYFPGKTWRVSTPEEQGIDSKGILAMLEKITGSTPYVHSFLLIRNGNLVTEAYFAPRNGDLGHILFSATKSFTSALVGIAIKEGYIKGVDQKILEFFPEMRKKNPSPNLEKLTIEHLLTMSTGHAFQVTPSPYKTEPVDWVDKFLGNVNNPMLYDPGSVFMYTSGAPHTLSAILQKTTGKSLSAYAVEKLFKPLGIHDSDWAADQNGITFGNSWLRITPLEMAKFGYLYLNNGNWNGNQVVPQEWVEKSTRKYIETRGVQINEAEQDGYGYLFWMNGFGGYAAHGYGGQYIFVVPQMDLVAVFTGGYDDDVFDTGYKLMRDFIIPSVKETAPLPKNEPARSALMGAIESRINPQKIPVPPLPKVALQFSGKTFLLADGASSVTFYFTDGANTYRVREMQPTGPNGTLKPVEYRGGLDGTFQLASLSDPILGKSITGVKGRWIDETTFEQIIIPIDNIPQTVFTCHFDEKTLTIDINTMISGKSLSQITVTATCCG